MGHSPLRGEPAPEPPLSPACAYFSVFLHQAVAEHLSELSPR